MKGVDVNPGSSVPGSTSSSLLARLRSQDADAWKRLARLYGPLVYGWCRRRGVQEADATDIVQEVFRAVLMGIGAYQAGSFRGWLWTITRNKLLDHYRRRAKQPDGVGGEGAQARLAAIPETLEDSEVEASGTGNLVRRALAMIRPDFTDATWQAFWRVMMENQEPAEVARQLGLSVNAIYIAKSRVLRRLRDELGDLV